MLRILERLQVRPNLGHDDLSDPLVDARQRVPGRQGGRKRAHLLLDLLIELGDGFIQKVNVTQMLRQHEAMMRPHTPAQRLQQQVLLVAQPAFGQLSQEGRIASGPARSDPASPAR